MKRHMCAQGLLLGAISVAALAAGTGIAHAEPDPAPAPGIVDFLLTNTPALSVNSSKNSTGESAPKDDWGGVGMYCTNLNAHCH
ncbi:hypothetical protein BST27_22815 [Mycobacterium intermedium]|uniref:DUF732 domain-containing protein n=1 Tax=Mycobacterium intermedium TaxID=28445 RepID=A0A1E3SHU2_MYCIE|nr:hypothetical protein BHQ20_08050 [Mycobacterium intermedium]OPE52249.1 hypothetical protein BV508_03525 [Mycobacterium intermedium]ORA97228.1 hypothetical protein BST27_22815 [Mycobacterium intermedium]